jgi:hypothetical protein
MPKAKKVRLPPAELVLARFGGPRELGRLTGSDPSAFSKWKARGGKVPLVNRADGSDWHERLLSLAKRQGKRLTQHELLHGGFA